MQEKIKNLIKEVLKDLNIGDTYFSVEHPEDLSNGDYSTNVAMISAKQFKLNPKELAEKIVSTLRKSQGEFRIDEIRIAGPGFINFYLSREFFNNKIEEISNKRDDWGKNEICKGKKIMVEYTDPNPFKPFHIGHLMTNAIGESISRIVEFSGARVVRANYQGDVGPHVAKAIYGIMKNPLPTLPLGKGEGKGGGVSEMSVSEQARYIGECYSKGSNLYDTDENVKKEIDEINKKIYDKSYEEINKIYDWGRKVTLDAFEEIYRTLGTKFDYYFFESEMAVKGTKIVETNERKIFDHSDGATVFHAEKYDPRLHTRVFINSQGLPTYETKEIGLNMAKFEKESPDLSIVVTATEQAEYMKVVQKAISLLHPDMEKRMKHITHGMMRLSTGKMSSRKGNIITGEQLINDSIEMVRGKMKEMNFTDVEKDDISKKVGVSALKYSILKSSLGSDIVYDFEKSISFDGDSGPYLQYTAVRANSILEKAKKFKTPSASGHSPLSGGEIISLERILYQFPEVVEHSYKNLETHHIAIYLTRLASEFNTFYNDTKILDENNKFIFYHLDLVKAFYKTMKNGLWLLGIEVPEKM